MGTPMETIPQGFEVPIHRSLTSPLLMAGVPREVAIINGTFTASIVLGLQFFWGIPIGILLHTMAVYATKRDPQFFEVLRRSMRLKPFYRA